MEFELLELVGGGIIAQMNLRRVSGATRTAQV